MPLVKGQSYTPQQIYQEDPEWLKTNSPQIWSNYEALKQKGQQTTSQGLGIQTQQADLPGAAARSAVAAATVGSDINKNLADTSVSVLEAQQKKDQIQSIMDLNSKRNLKSAQNPKGDNFVSPQDYDKQKTSYVNAGGDATKFDQEMGGIRNPLNPNYILTDPESNRIQQNTNAAIREYSQFKDKDLSSLGVGSQDAADVYALKQGIDSTGHSNPGTILGLINTWAGSKLGAKTEADLTPKQKELFKLQQNLDIFYTNMAATLNSRGLTPTDVQQVQSFKPTIYDDPEILNHKVSSLLRMVGNTADVLPTNDQVTNNNQNGGGAQVLDQLFSKHYGQ